MHFSPSRKAGLAALDDFIPRAGKAYSSERNYDLGPDKHYNVSCLSPYTRLRLVAESEIVAKVLQRYSPSTAEKYIQEVFWRTYFKGWLEHRPDVWSTYLDDLSEQKTRLEDDPGLRTAYREAIEGRTGIDCFDAWAEELIEYSYLHNHARMWFASIWVFTLKLPWELGADFFLTHLLDGDPASNTLSWRWVSGLHTRGKNYIARASNIAKYTDGRFKPEHQLNTQAEALEEPYEFDPEPLRGGDPLPREGQLGLLITMEDLHAESLLNSTDFAAIACLNHTGETDSIDLAEPVKTFRLAAIDDAAARAEATFGQAPGRVGEGCDNATAILNWAQTNNLDTVVSPFTPVGPVNDTLNAAERMLNGDGRRLARLQRTLDSLAWPHTKKGFFGLKKKIPGLIGDLGLDGQSDLYG